MLLGKDDGARELMQRVVGLQREAAAVRADSSRRATLKKPTSPPCTSSCGFRLWTLNFPHPLLQHRILQQRTTSVADAGIGIVGSSPCLRSPPR
ncbi:hypothetical protein SBA4_2480020 [Candidatus Sulfopaludibacter sp. SbA4]|nr:hypothetical protein SBA4_2480020 [Candidatus Sulfopaludibacter sp. SbA4]